MNLITWSWQPLSIVILLVIMLLYVRGWRRLRRIWPNFASPMRLVAFGAGILLLTMVLISPIYGLSGYFLAARSLQKVLICMIVPPVLWLSCPFHFMAWGVPSSLRRGITRLFLRPSMVRSVVCTITQPGLTWLIFVASFLLWHEPTVARWTLQYNAVHVGALWLLLSAALLYWWHIIGTGPRLHATLPAWGCFVYLLGVEAPNMFAGVYIAFSRTSIYPYYAAVHDTFPTLADAFPYLNLIEDQMLGGGIIWIIGSLVYIFSIVVVFNQLFKQEDELPPLLRYSQRADERTIAPGLEHRVQRNRWRESGYGSGSSS